MNWQKIKDECPKAFELYRLWGFEPENNYRDPHLRMLFDFFDEKGIIINIDSWCKLTIDTFEHYLLGE